MSCLCELVVVSSLLKDCQDSSECFVVPSMCGIEDTKCCSVGPLVIVEGAEGCTTAKPRSIFIGMPPVARLMRETHTRASGFNPRKNTYPGRWQ